RRTLSTRSSRQSLRSSAAGVPGPTKASPRSYSSLLDLAMPVTFRLRSTARPRRSSLRLARAGLRFVPAAIPYGATLVYPHRREDENAKCSDSLRSASIGRQVVPASFQECPAMAKFALGQSVSRVEDLTLVRGAGRYADDVRLPNEVYAYVLRSPHAHAVIRRIDAAAARKA